MYIYVCTYIMYSNVIYIIALKGELNDSERHFSTSKNSMVKFITYTCIYIQVVITYHVNSVALVTKTKTLSFLIRTSLLFA